MSDLVNWLKEVYDAAKSGKFEWKPVYPNNMICNGVEGLYTDMVFKDGNKYTYLKFTIEYGYRCDKEGLSHPEEGIKYYILHEFRLNDLEDIIEIPDPADDFDWDDKMANMVNNYGRFRYVFDDEETAKCVVANELLMIIYPYTYLLSKEDMEEWRRYIEENN